MVVVVFVFVVLFFVGVFVVGVGFGGGGVGFGSVVGDVVDGIFGEEEGGDDGESFYGWLIVDRVVDFWLCFDVLGVNCL